MKNNIIVVDDYDNIIGYKPRDIVDKEGLRYRVSVLWIENSKGEVLLAKRALTKTHQPGKWGPAVTGTVEEGESYEDNIIKESKEELGLNNINLKIGLKIKIDSKYKYFVQCFFTVIDKPIEYFKVQIEEVAKIKWFSKEELKKQLKLSPDEFVNSLKEIVKHYIK